MHRAGAPTSTSLSANKAISDSGSARQDGFGKLPATVLSSIASSQLVDAQSDSAPGIGHVALADAVRPVTILGR